MTKIIDTTNFHCRSLNAPIVFEHVGPNASNGLFTRQLMLKGEAAYELSFSCGTCRFLFERLGGANSNVSVEELDSTLKNGIRSIDTPLLSLIEPIIPPGEYIVNLLEINTELIEPLSVKDYFNHEQTALWGVDPFWGLPHYPKTEYYRTHTQEIGDKKALFEFVVPMTPKNWLNQKTTEMYIGDISNGAKPTAIALAVLDVKQPADWEGDPSINEHWCFAHFLLDGHHKLFASSQIQKSITLLSFLAVNECIADDEQIDLVQDQFSHKL